LKQQEAAEGSKSSAAFNFNITQETYNLQAAPYTEVGEGVEGEGTIQCVIPVRDMIWVYPRDGS